MGTDFGPITMLKSPAVENTDTYDLGRGASDADRGLRLQRLRARNQADRRSRRCSPTGRCPGAALGGLRRHRARCHRARVRFTAPADRQRCVLPRFSTSPCPSTSSTPQRRCRRSSSPTSRRRWTVSATAAMAWATPPAICSWSRPSRGRRCGLRDPGHPRVGQWWPVEREQPEHLPTRSWTSTTST